ncbi:MAG: TlpA family protein disulfide reductase [Thermoleophilaceae bacterium]|nr:TlpA family protein disulfide reductase [Thermoleophilaceae bacterium]
MPISPLRRYRAAAPLLVVVALVTASCGADDGADGANGGGAAQPSVQTPTAGLPPRLASNLKQGDQIIGEGKDVFDRRLRELRGHPVVVNQWASWCPSCRFEFPFFAAAVKRYRAEVGFLGLDSQDETGPAEDFLREHPVGFPSISDPSAEVAAAYGGGQAWPTTIFFDSEGEVANVKIGAYATAELLDEDIRRYALGGGG